ncbi:MAG TPA: hypothetical protein VF759_09965 [Allosphingosinicella sp.]
MRKRERQAYILQRAREMAATGEYRNWHHIEVHLRSDGYPEARSVLDDSFIRRELDEACKGRSIYDA